MNALLIAMLFSALIFSFIDSRLTQSPQPSQSPLQVNTLIQSPQPSQSPLQVNILNQAPQPLRLILAATEAPATYPNCNRIRARSATDLPFTGYGQMSMCNIVPTVFNLSLSFLLELQMCNIVGLQCVL